MNQQATKNTGHSDTTTDGIRVRVAAQYVPSQSMPEQGHFMYVYRVIISNEGDEVATLKSRHWIIRDAVNEMEEVRGPGVIGQFPELEPGEQFEYMSGCPLGTEWGTMEGSFTMERPDGSKFDAEVGRFFLAPNVAPLTAL